MGVECIRYFEVLEGSGLCRLEGGWSVEGVM